MPQATRSREGGATQHGWRWLSDVTRDDSQSQSRVGRRPGAGGRELIRRPGVTRIQFLLNISLHPAALFLSHRPPARLETTPQSEQPQLTLSLCLSPLGLFIEHASGRRPGPKELFVAALWDSQTWQAWDVCLGKKNKNKQKTTHWDLFH